MYYSIEVIINLNKEFIVLIVNRMQYPNRDNAGVLVLKIDTDSHFFLGCAEQAQK